jgi:ribosomal protein S14
VLRQLSANEFEKRGYVRDERCGRGNAAVLGETAM